MNNKERFFEELQRAIARGFTLAGISAALSCGTPAVPDAGPVVAHQSDGGQLSQAPDSSGACDRDAGECCSNLYCYEPLNGECAEHHYDADLKGLPNPSFNCSCGGEGPFAQPDGGTTGCCYVVAYKSCVVGRPLREGDDTLVAAVVTRSDWS